MLWVAKGRINLRMERLHFALPAPRSSCFCPNHTWNPHAQAQASRVKPSLATNIPLSLCYHKARVLPFSTSLRPLLLAETRSATLHTKSALSCQANPTPDDSQVLKPPVVKLANRRHVLWVLICPFRRQDSRQPPHHVAGGMTRYLGGSCGMCVCTYMHICACKVPLRYAAPPSRYSQLTGFQ
jgi:hypothetical protein